MEKVRQFRDQFARSRRLPWLVIGLTLAVLAGAILAGGLRLRGRVREQLAGRDGAAFDELALWQQQDKAGQEMLTTIDDPAEQFNLALKISRIRGVLGIRLFSADGKFNTAFPASITESVLSAEDLARLAALKPVSHYRASADLASVDLLSQLDGADKPVPLLEVNVPLHAPGKNRLAGVAQFITDGKDIAREYADLDRHLFLQAGVTFLAAGAILTLALGLAFARLQRANRQLAERTERLTQANQELVLAAKASAVGAVTSHLIHGLKNPISGLQGFMKSHQQGGTAGGSEAEWEDAVAATQHMQSLISGVARILEEQQAAGDYELSLRELVEIVAAKMLPVARAAGVHFFTNLATEATLTNRDANLAILILENLIQNAFQATPEGKSVQLLVMRAGGKIHCEVRDEGPGLPEGLEARLFTPCRSTKAGGGGIGLAISRQLAQQIGAVLELRRNSAEGCVFRLSLPQAVTAEGRVGRGETVSK